MFKAPHPAIRRHPAVPSYAQNTGASGIFYILCPIVLLITLLAIEPVAIEGSGGIITRTSRFYLFARNILFVIITLQLPNTVIGLAASTIFAGAALAVAIAAGTLTLAGRVIIRSRRLSSVVDRFLLKHALTEVIVDVWFHAITVFFIVLRPVMNLGMGVMMGGITSYAALILFLIAVPARGVGSVVVYVGAMVVVYSIKLFTALLQTYFLFLFSSAVSAGY